MPPLLLGLGSILITGAIDYAMRPGEAMPGISERFTLPPLRHQPNGGKLLTIALHNTDPQFFGPGTSVKTISNSACWHRR